MTKLTILKLIFVLLATCVLCIRPAIAVKIVRLQIEYGSDLIVATGGLDIPKTNKVLDLELFDDVTGLDLELFDGIEDVTAPTATVANYLNYVNSGRFDDAFFTRSISGFILQSGGAANKPADPVNDDIVQGIAAVEAFPPVVNEPGISNIRGTIAMAKPASVFIDSDGVRCAVGDPSCTLLAGTGPDSATSEWFISLGDNSGLNTVDEKFTVFGSVIDDGMETVDELSSFPVTGFFSLFFSVSVVGTSFDALPFADDNFNVDGGELQRRNLLLITKAAEINRPILRFSPAVSNFGSQAIDFVTAGESIDVVLKNTGNEILDVGPIDKIAIDLPFSIESEDCSNTTLAPISTTPASSCTISLKFLPSSTGRFTDDLMINYTSQASGESFSVNYSLIGEGGIPGIEVADTFEITSQVDGFVTTRDLVVKNTGQASLQILSISGLDSTAFSQTNNCIGSNVFVAPGETCSVSINFTASAFSTKVATLSIESDDPVNSIVSITLSGLGDTDADGVPTIIENAAPNAGDYNADSVADNLQNNVASFIDKTGSYIAVAVDDSDVVLSNISLIPDNQLTDLPADVVFKNGTFEYDVVVGAPGELVEIFMLLPPDSALESYYFFGETTDNETPHWYKYQFVQVLSGATFTGSSGTKIERDFLQITVQDGGSGDTDQLVNGRIALALGAPAYSVNGSGDSGSSAMNILFLGILFVFFLMLQRKRYP